MSTVHTIQQCEQRGVIDHSIRAEGGRDTYTICPIPQLAWTNITTLLASTMSSFVPSDQFYTVVLLNAASHCDPLTLISLRLLNRTTRYLFDTFERSICVTAAKALSINKVAYRRDPTARHTFQDLKRVWRYEQVVRHLATEVGVHGDYMYLHWTPVACPEAWVPIRIRLEEAFHLWFHFSDIAREVEGRMEDRRLKGRFKGRFKGRLVRAKQLEARILQARIEYLETLSNWDITSLALMWFMLTCSAHAPHHYKLLLTESDHYSWDHWINWYMLKLGPEFFYNPPNKWTWDRNPSYYYWKGFGEEFSSRPPKLVRVEIRASRAFYRRFFDIRDDAFKRSNTTYDDFRKSYRRIFEDYGISRKLLSKRELGIIGLQDNRALKCTEELLDEWDTSPVELHSIRKFIRWQVWPFELSQAYFMKIVLKEACSY